MRIPNEKLLATYRTPGPCEACLKWCNVREPHHIWPKGHGGANTLDIHINLVALGSTPRFECQCHSNAPGILTRTHCLMIVSKRESVAVQDIIATIYLLRRLPKHPTRSQAQEWIGMEPASVRELAWRMLDGHLLEDVA